MCCAHPKQKMSKAELAAYRAGINEVRRLARARYEARLTEAARSDPSLGAWMDTLRARAIRYAYPDPAMAMTPLTRREISALWVGDDRTDVPAVLRQAEAVVERVASELVPV